MTPKPPAWAAPSPTSLDIDLSRELPWAIGPCIAPGDCAYFVGLDGEGKTTMVADILWGALAPAEFDNPLGHGTCLADAWHVNRAFLPHGSRALVLNGETTDKKSWARKLAETGWARGVAPFGELDRELRSRVDFLNADEIVLRQETMYADCRAFGRWIGRSGYKLVVIDPVFNFFDPPDNADSAWVNKGLRPLVIAMKEFGVTSLCIAHPSSIAMQKGRRNGPRLQQVYAPFGTAQQKYVQDARFGVFRPESNQQMVELVKLKDRRETDAWIPKGASRIRLAFSPSGGGYTGVILSGSGWEYYDPTGGVVLGEQPRKLLAILPPETFESAVLEELGIAKKAWIKMRDTFLLPQKILSAEVLSAPGAPIRYTWSEKGLRAREAARRDFPYEVERAEA